MRVIYGIVVVVIVVVVIVVVVIVVVVNVHIVVVVELLQGTTSNKMDVLLVVHFDPESEKQILHT